MHNTLLTEEVVKKSTSNPIGILFVGSNVSEPSSLIIPTAFERRYIEFDLPAARRFCIPLEARCRKSDGTFCSETTEKILDNTSIFSFGDSGCKTSRNMLTIDNGSETVVSEERAGATDERVHSEPVGREE